MAYLGTSESLILLLGDGGDKPASDILLAPLSDIPAFGRELSTLELCIDYFFEFPRQSCVGFQEPRGICSNKVQEVWVNWPELLPCRPGIQTSSECLHCLLGSGKEIQCLWAFNFFPASGEVCFRDHRGGGPSFSWKSSSGHQEWSLHSGNHFVSYFYHFLAV